MEQASRAFYKQYVCQHTTLNKGLLRNPAVNITYADIHIDICRVRVKLSLFNILDVGRVSAS